MLTYESTTVEEKAQGNETSDVDVETPLCGLHQKRVFTL